jgi:hypothetical protein
MHRQPHPEPQTHAPRTSIVGLRDASADRSLRAGDDDRRRVADLLQAHYVAGRLTQSELEGRLQEAVEAKTLADLDALLNDLPDLGRPADDEPAPTSRAERAEAAVGCGEQSFRRHAISYLLVIGMLVAIWALTSPGGYFWPVWPMLGWGVGLAWHGLNGRTRPRHRDGHWSGFSGH